jgi:ATP-binding protein involved in chromosome partitioning
MRVKRKMNELNIDLIKSALSEVKEPRLDVNLLSSNLIRNIQLHGSKVSCELILIAPEHPDKDSMIKEVDEAIRKISGVTDVEILTKIEIPFDAKLKNESDNEIRNVIAIASGKGGVGKSTVAVNMAVALAQTGVKVGLLDADIYGPNIPRMMGVERLPNPTEENKIAPAEIHGLKIMSIGFMVQKETPLIWRGPMLNSAIKQFITDVTWGELDYLIVDLPPGTGDAQLSLIQNLSITGGVIVTMPQKVSLDDARRGLHMFKSMELPILGVVENMSYLELPDGQKMDIFGNGGGKILADETGSAYLGGIPLDPAVREGGDLGKPIIIEKPDSDAAKKLVQIAKAVSLSSSITAYKNQASGLKINL